MKEKAAIREKIWKLLEEKDVARFPRPVKGRIPNFEGAEAAAANLFKLKIWKAAKIVKINPDSPQRLVREQALKDGKILYASVPRLRQPFFLKLDPKKIKNPRAASTIRGSFRFGQKTEIENMDKIDLVVVGVVAASPDGAKLGKGGGYSDLTFALLSEFGLVDAKTPVATTVHELQIVKEIPVTEQDLPVDFIATPKKIIETKTKYPKPSKIDWSLLTKEKLEEIPLLKKLQTRIKL